MLKLLVEKRKVQMDIESWAIPIQAKMMIVLDQCGADVVQWLRSYTNTWRPPVRGSTASRRAHPGGWGDITHDLERSYGYRVERLGRTGAQLVIFNKSDHAVYVEAMDGFYVVSGIADSRSAAMQRIKAVLRKLSPSWNVV